MVKRLMIHIDEEKCTGCGLCVPSCEEGALAIVDGKAKVVSESYCDGLGACLGHCPEGALTLLEVDTVPFDEDAAMDHVQNLRGTHQSSSCCPTVSLNDSSETQKDQPSSYRGGVSYLQNFPVKLKLIAPNHPALRDTSLLLSADCTSIAYPALHNDFLQGKTIIQVCPKFEEYSSNVDKLAQIFHVNSIKDITTLIMEVPCCSGLVRMIKQALQIAGKDLPITSHIIGVRGNILSTSIVT